MAGGGRWHRHLGVYAVTRDDPRGLLVIRKTRGPYAGRFDLPGGSLQDEESLAQALQRELREETGYECRMTGPFGVHEFLVRTDHAGTLYTHHIAVLRTVELQGTGGEVGGQVHYQDRVEANDSSGSIFLPFDVDPDSTRCSPLVRRCLDILCGRQYPEELVLMDPTM